MTFISYAQNFEDVLLWRALGHLEHGFYIDLGAWSPVHDSVTAAFYESGWSGINVEPNPELHAELVTARPRDINLACAVTEREGETELWLAGNSGLGCVQESQQARDLEPTRRVNVVCTTLNAIITEHVPSDQNIHFLKIDIEGMEATVINSTNWQGCRPWIVVVEATTPMTMTPNFDAWEPTLLHADYGFVYSDGINRFYLANEHSDLAVHFGHPPNYFDNIISFDHHLAINTHSEVREWAEHLEENARKQQKALELQLESTNKLWTTKFQALQLRVATAMHEKQRVHRALADARNEAQEREAALHLRIAQMQTEAEQREAQMQTEAEQRIAEATAIIFDFRNRLNNSEATRQAMLNSTSWRATAPLRAMVMALKRAKN